MANRAFNGYLGIDRSACKWPEHVAVMISLIGEPDTDEDAWALRFPILDELDALPLEAAETYRFGCPLPRLGVVETEGRRLAIHCSEHVRSAVGVDISATTEPRWRGDVACG